MKCKAAHKRLSACVDRDLTFEEESRVREHLQECADCARELERVERMVALLDNLPETDPGPGFYAAVQRRIREASAQPQGERESGSRIRGVWERLAVPALKPAVGAAFLGLAVGIVAGLSGAPRLEGWIGGSNPPVYVASETVARPAVTPPVSESSPRSPIADLDLSHLAALGDTVRLESDPEFVLERYTADPQRGLIPAEAGYGRQVSDDQSEAFITF